MEPNGFDSLLPPLSTEEFSALEADIKEHGVRHPVFIDEKGDVLDGRHRLKNRPKRTKEGNQRPFAGREGSLRLPVQLRKTQPVAGSEGRRRGRR